MKIKITFFIIPSLLLSAFAYAGKLPSKKNKSLLINKTSTNASSESAIKINSDKLSISSIEVIGKVTDEKGLVLIGATVTEKGTNNTTPVKNDGSFIIKVSGPSAILVVTFIGYQTKEIIVGNNRNLVIQLQPASATLSDVVVIGYGSSNKKDLTGAITTVTSKDFTTGAITSPENLIAGKVPGLSITPGSGQPGSGAAIYIRGISSINANQRPLIVVDGIPLDQDGIAGSTNSLALINPNDIESFTVLKDASAAAIYGSRASGGVILITTKKGKSGGKVNITFNTNNSVSVITKGIPVLSAQQFRQIVDSLGTSAQKAALGTANTNWSKQIFQPAFATDNNLSFSGGIKNLPYRLSLGYLDQNGTLKTGSYERYSSALNLSPSFFTDHLKINVNVLGTIEKDRIADVTAINAATYFDPTQPVRSASSPFGGYFEYIDPTTGYVNPKNPINPLDYLQENNRSRANKLTGNVNADYRFHFLPELRANLNLAIENTNGYSSYYSPLTEAAAAQSGGAIGSSQETKRNKTAEFYLNYNKTLKSIKSNIDVTAGYGYYDFKYGIPKSIGKNLKGDTTHINLADSAQNTLISYYARVQYKYDNRLFLTGTIRTDGSSRFAPQTRWGTFPSGALAYQFITNSSAILNSLKLRIGYGITGQQDIGSYYGYIPAYTVSASNNKYGFGGQFINTVSPGGYNTDLKWETTATTNLGLDYGLFNDKINGSIEVYQKKTSNMLVDANLPAGANLVSSIYQNIGSMENKGIEISFNATPIKTSNFQWNLNLNGSYNQNKVTKLTQYPNPSFQGYPVGAVQTIKVGYPIYSFFTYKQLYNSAGKPIEGSYEDFDHNGVINTADQYVGKSPLPKYILGFTSNFQYEKFNFGFVARANIGNYAYNANAASKGDYTWMLGTFLVPVNAPSNLLQTQFKTLQTYSDYYIQNASFLKIDNINAGYNFGKIFNNQVDLVVSVVVQNAFVFTKYTGVDPEVAGGIDSDLYPRSRIYNLALKLQF